MADFLIKDTTLTDIADAIRAKKGTSEIIDPADFASEISTIEGGGTTIPDGEGAIHVPETVPFAGEYQFNESLIETGAWSTVSETVESELMQIDGNTFIQTNGMYLLPVYVRDMDALIVYMFISREVTNSLLGTAYERIGGEIRKDNLSSETFELIDPGAFGAWILANVSTEGGACDKSHVIEVAELPTENIDENAVYFCGGNYYTYAVPRFSDVAVYADYMGWVRYLEYMTELGLPPEQVSANVIPTKTTEGILESDAQNTMHFYYIVDEDNVFLFVEGQWMTTEEMSDGQTLYGGVIYDISEATDPSKYYALFDGGWTLYAPIKGSLLIEENGEYDVTNVETVNVDIYIPTVANQTLSIEGVSAGASRYFSTSEYYNSFSIKSLPSQDIVATLGTEEKVYTADEGHVLKSVTVPAADLSKTTLLCGIAIDTFPGTAYAVGEYPSVNGGKIKRFFTNGETDIIDLDLSWCSGIVPAYQKGIGEHKIKVSYDYEGIHTETYYQVTIGDLCTITIDSKNFGALDGMTWGAWVESSFNKILQIATSIGNTTNYTYEKGYTIGVDGFVWYRTECQVLYNGNPIAATDTIMGGASYDHNSG